MDNQNSSSNQNPSINIQNSSDHKEQVKQAALSFLKTKVVAVLATLNTEGKPTAATIYYDIDSDFTFYFLTKLITNKYQNLQKNSSVALVVGTENTPTTIQIEGGAVEIKEYDKKLIAMDRVARKALTGMYGPPINKFPDAELAVFKVIPTRIRFLDQTNVYLQHDGLTPVEIIP